MYPEFYPNHRDHVSKKMCETCIVLINVSVKNFFHITFYLIYVFQNKHLNMRFYESITVD